MPKYDYQCPKCEEIIERTHSITYTPEMTCSKCLAPMKRWIAPVSSHFKGKGWASDGYAK